MTTVAATSGSTSLPPRGPGSPLETALQQRPALIGLLTRVAGSEGLDAAAAKDVTHIVLESAIKRERRGQGWDPAGRFTVERYLVAMLYNGIDDWRRSMRRNPAIPTGDAIDVVSAAPEIEQAPADEDVENRRLDGLEEALRDFFADETGGDIPIGIMDQRIDGVVAHDEIAAALKCSPQDVKRGYDRLVHHAKRLAGLGGKKGKPS
jgi:hypothetical protein